MITNADIEKLKKVFATKDDLRQFATKEDFKNELKNELGKYATKKDIEEITEQIVVRLAEDIGNLIGENKSIENRLQKVEHKVFPQ